MLVKGVFSGLYARVTIAFMRPIFLQRCTSSAGSWFDRAALLNGVRKRRWYLLVPAAAVFAVGAGSAQPRVGNAVLTPPAAADAAAAAPASAPIPPAADPAVVRTAIERANARWLDGFRTGDVQLLAGIYAPDASLSPPADASLEGRDSIVSYFRAQRRAGMAEASLKTLDVVVVGDVAYEVGTYGFRFDGGVLSTAGDAGRYFTIWKAQPDGTWRYQVGIWNSNRDLAARN